MVKDRDGGIACSCFFHPDGKLLHAITLPEIISADRLFLVTYSTVLLDYMFAGFSKQALVYAPEIYLGACHCISYVLVCNYSILA